MKSVHDYTKCMMTKLMMAVPDRKGGTIVCRNCEDALKTIKETDALTLGVKKIVYLVGWQYNGHDDKYPAFFEVNKGIGRKEDATVRDSLLWLIEEAKKYNTVVSVHINFADAYKDSPLFDDFVKAGALIRNAFGKPAKIEKYNGMPCYKVSYKEEWESGLFKKRADKLLSVLPLEEAGTVHVDNFQCYVNRKPFVSAAEMQSYRDKMIEYFADKGIDITSEFTYREGKGTAVMYGRITRDVTPARYPIALLDKIPAVWWVDKMTVKEYFDYYPQRYCGGMPKHKKIRKMLYGNIHCEDLWLKDDWHGEFLKQFYTINLPFFFLAGKKKKRLGNGNKFVEYEDGTISYADGRIVSGGRTVKDGDFVCLPFMGGTAVYSGGRTQAECFVPSEKAVVYTITTEGLKKSGEYRVNNGKLSFECNAATAYYIK